jgi:glycine/D-amino acid oxidase-like deaminating enzyme
MSTFDIAIVGAGIVGAACAAALSQEGLRVAIIDRYRPGTGTTAAGMGHIVVMDDSEAQFALTKYSQRLWNELADQLPSSCEYEHCGTIWVAADEEEMDEVRRKHEFYKTHGIETEILDQRSLRCAERNLSEHLAGGLLVRDDSVVYQLTANTFLIDRARSNGAKLFCGNRAIEFTNSGVKLENGESILASNIVNAAGANAGKLSPELQIRMRKGHLVITERYRHFASHQLVELGYLKSAHGTNADSVAFNVQPRSTGQLLIGSSRQFDADRTDVDRGILARMTSRAFEYMPKLRDLAAVRVWTGFRPSTPDNLPYIGRIPGFENVYAAAGHEGLGITNALGTAALLTDQIVGRPTAIPIDPYLPSRKNSEH